MKITGIPFQPGSRKVINPKMEKRYLPFLERSGQRRYAIHGRLNFKRSSDALKYACQWADRIERILSAKKESGIVN